MRSARSRRPPRTEPPGVKAALLGADRLRSPPCCTTASGDTRRHSRPHARACEYEDLGFHGWCLFELIEAARAYRRARKRLRWRCGGSTSARAPAEPTGAWVSWQMRERCWPTTTTPRAYSLEAIERLERTRIVVHLARARLPYGEWLRRVNRRLDARQQLSEAYEMFTRMGAQAFAERARRELVATGEKVRKQPVSSGDELTAQEAQIARLAGDGPDESGDRCAAVHQHAHRRMASAEGLRQARHHLAQAAPHHFLGELDCRRPGHPPDHWSTTDYGLLTTDFQGFARPSLTARLSETARTRALTSGQTVQPTEIRS